MSPRDKAKLMVYDRATERISYSDFRHIGSFIPKNSVLIFNNTKVIPARMILQKQTGGSVEALYLGREGKNIKVLLSGKHKEGSTLSWKKNLSFTFIDKKLNESLLKPNFKINLFDQYLEKYGETPLPPYMKDSTLTEKKRRNEYQTIYAKKKGSIAAPTAGLHFSKRLIKKLEQFGVQIHYITLHVHLGTFQPLKEENLINNKLHLEHYSIDEKTLSELNKAKKGGKNLIAVGTTTVRALESASNGNQLVKTSGSTDLFIQENYKLQFVDSLITNFHVPKSSLLMLVSAFTGRERLLKLYEEAIERKFRLFSFGDGMMVL